LGSKKSTGKRWLSMAEIARNLGVGTSAIGMAKGRMKDENEK
jgi:2-iminoacetate synthase ThiH